MALEIDLNGHRYSIGKLSAKQQFHMSRRIAPIVPTLIPVFVRGGGRQADQRGSGRHGRCAPTPGRWLAAMKDEDAEYVLDTCMQAVQRKQEHGWANIWSASQRVPMFQDIDGRHAAAGAARDHREPRAFYSRAAYQPDRQPRGDTGWLKRLRR